MEYRSRISAKSERLPQTISLLGRSGKSKTFRHDLMSNIFSAELVWTLIWTTAKSLKSGRLTNVFMGLGMLI